MKLLAFAGIAAFIATVITASLHFYGSHDIQGFFAAVAGYPGLLASGADKPLNEAVFTVVNWLFYFVVLEGAFAIKRKFSTQVNSHKQC